MTEHYIPCSRSELVRLCISDFDKSEEDKKQFYELCQILMAYMHHQEQASLEELKSLYTLYDPDIESKSDLTFPAINTITAINDALEKANYIKLSQEDIHNSLNSSSLIPVNTSVDFSQYDHYHFYYRNQFNESVTIKNWFRKKQIDFLNYSRMVVLLKTNDTFKKDKDERETFKANRLYLYLYKNIPHADLEMLFPNLKISMTIKDRLFLIIPALGAAIPLFLKVLPSLAILIGAVLFFTFGSDLGTGYKLDHTDDKAIYALLTAVLSVGLALGGFATQQYIKYKNKRLSFLKQVTETLFFKCLDSGSGVIHKIIDEAEEELCKEMILILFILNHSKSGMSEIEIDHAIEAWIEQKLNIKMDFDVKKALTTLATLSDNKNAILYQTDTGHYKMHSLEQCKTIIDQLWDNIFQYNQN